MNWTEESIATLTAVPTDFLWQALTRDDFQGTGDGFHAGFENWKITTEYIRRRKWGWRHLKSLFKLLLNVQEKVEEATRYTRDMYFKTFLTGLAKVQLSIKGPRLAVVPQETRVGDVVCVLLGLSVPILLREEKDRRGVFKVVGGCYVDRLDLMLYEQYREKPPMDSAREKGRPEEIDIVIE